MKGIKFGLIVLVTISTAITAVAQQKTGKGPQNYLQHKTGKWQVEMTLKPTFDAPAQIIKGIVAERTMIGEFCLHELMHPAVGVKMPPFQRLSDLAYNKNEQRWDYMSIDTRITAGIMYFTYLEDNATSITSFITSFPNPGFPPDNKGRGQSVYTRNVIIKINEDHDMIRQYWRLTDQREWLAVQYDYTRNK